MNDVERYEPPILAPVQLLVRAIAAVLADAATKAARADGIKPDKAVITLNAMEQAKALTPQQLKEARELASVQIELAKLKGSDGSITAIVGVGVTAPC